MRHCLLWHKIKHLHLPVLVERSAEFLTPVLFRVATSFQDVPSKHQYLRLLPASVAVHWGLSDGLTQNAAGSWYSHHSNTYQAHTWLLFNRPVFLYDHHWFGHFCTDLTTKTFVTAGARPFTNRMLFMTFNPPSRGSARKDYSCTKTHSVFTLVQKKKISHRQLGSLRGSSPPLAPWAGEG